MRSFVISQPRSQSEKDRESSGRGESSSDCRRHCRLTATAAAADVATRFSTHALGQGVPTKFDF